MKISTLLSAVMVCGALTLTSTSYAQVAPRGHHGGGNGAGAARRAASNANMSSGLSALMSAQAALQGGNASGAITSLQGAIGSFNQAAPIYHGARERAIHAASNAIKVLGMNKKKSGEHAAALIGKAISEARLALGMS